MTQAEIMQQLEALALPSYKSILLKHGIKEPMYGVKIEELQKIRKKVKDGHDIAMGLYDTGIYDAMYLAGLMVVPAKMSVADLQHWADAASSPALREYTVAWVAAENEHGMEKALEWIEAKNEHLQTIGWATLANIVSLKEDSELDVVLLAKLLKRIAKTINTSPNRVKMTMNGFIIAVGSYVKELNELAKQTAIEIGKVKVDMGDTACKVPYAIDYIEKVEKKNAIGKKKKSARCL